jgi:two-component system, sensor histidine kinase
VLRSASELDYPPFALVRPDGGADGFSVDLLEEVVRAAGLDIEFRVGPWHKIKQMLIDKKLDVLPLVSYSAQRDKEVDFSAPYLRMHGTIFVRSGNKTIKSREDLKDKEVLVMRGDTAHEYALKEHLSEHLILTDSFEQAMEDLSRGEHDAVIIQHLVGLELIKKLGITNLVSVDNIREKDLRPTAKPLGGFEQKFCFAVQEGDAALLARLNEGLSITIANGTYDVLYDKWFGPILPPAPISVRELVGYLVSILVPILFILLMAGLWYLRRQVSAKTQSLRQEIQERKRAQVEKEDLIVELRKALKEVKTLGGLLPICSSCKKIRDDQGYWNQIESFIREHSDAEFSHGICPDCIEKLYPEYATTAKKKSHFQ